VIEAPPLTAPFAAATRSAVHLEMRDGYALGDAMLAAWRAGHRDEPADRDAWWRPWHELVRSAVRRGVSVWRARIVSEPVSEYIRFEYDVTFNNVEAGEDVRWLPRRQATDLALPGNDFWLFDDQELIINHFDGNGDKTAGELITDPATIKLCAAAFEAVWARAVPHAQYRPA
jgi:hypothetical protein